MIITRLPIQSLFAGLAAQLDYEYEVQASRKYTYILYVAFHKTLAGASQTLQWNYIKIDPIDSNYTGCTWCRLCHNLFSLWAYKVTSIDNDIEFWQFGKFNISPFSSGTRMRKRQPRRWIRWLWKMRPWPCGCQSFQPRKMFAKVIPKFLNNLFLLPRGFLLAQSASASSSWCPGWAQSFPPSSCSRSPTRQTRTTKWLRQMCK